MTYRPPVAVLEWMPTIWPGCNTYSGQRPIWTAFTTSPQPWVPFPDNTGGEPGDRLLSFTIDRGRQSLTEKFHAGVMHLVLDNTDGRLTPFGPGSLTADTFGCPVRLSMFNPATGNTSIIFTGFVDSSWIPSWGHGRRRDIQVDIVDWYGRSATDDVPGCPMNIVNNTWSGSPPGTALLWWRGAMTASQASPTTNATVTDFGRSANDGQITSGVVTAVDPLTGADYPCLELAGDTTITSVDEFVADGTTPVTASLIASIPAAGSWGGELYLLSCVSTGGVRRWSISVDVLGRIKTAVYSAAGAVVATTQTTNTYLEKTVVISILVDYTLQRLFALPEALGDTTWSTTGATPTGHIVAAGVPSSTAPARTQVGNVAVTANTGDIQAAGYVADTNMQNTVQITWASTGWQSQNPGRMDMPPIVGRLPESPQINAPVGSWGSHQAWLDAVADGIGGVVWCQRDGRIHLRSGADLGWWPATRPANDAVDDGLYQVVARLTDAPAPDPIVGAVSGTVYQYPILRYSGPGATGPDPERVINQVTIDRAMVVDPGSLRRYGARTYTMTPQRSEKPGWVSPRPVGSLFKHVTYPVPTVPDDPMSTQAQALIDQRATPTAAIPAATLQPYGDPDITKFVLEDLELEARVLVTQSDQVTGAPIYEDEPVRVQSESWTWANGGADWTVTLDLAAPTPNK